MSGVARVLMVQGTASGVGKSWLVTGLCRALARRGRSVAPFKAQNMSNNAAVTAGGGEVGRAQAVQAEAAFVDIDERMNPILVKPLGDRRSEVVASGRSRPDLSALPWRDRAARLWPIARDALDDLRRDFEWVVIEGAGSPAEVNLRDSDVANMTVARHASAPVLLVADIDRGGALAALLGTWSLLPPEERALLRGFVLNRFRGDPTLLGDATAVLRRLTGVETLGVIPWVEHRIPEEDAAPVEREASGDGPVGVVRLPRMANFDDVLPLERMGPGVRWVTQPEHLDGVRAIVVPGTRNTPGDLAWLRATGLGARVCDLSRTGVPVLGICGGLQALGLRVDDPAGVEGGGRTEGLGLLPVATVLSARKTVRRVRARWQDGPTERLLEGYEIHHGDTRPSGSADPFMAPAEGSGAPLAYRTGSVWGTYLHGCLRDDDFRRAWLDLAGLRTAPSSGPDPIDAVADAVERSLDLDALIEEDAAGVPSAAPHLVRSASRP